MSNEKFDLRSVRETFILESKELLSGMEASLLSLEKDPLNEGSINAIFRAAHSIKGGAGMVGFDKIGEFTHVLENLLDKVRNFLIPVDSKMIELLLHCHDFILEMFDFFSKTIDEELSEQATVVFRELTNQLNDYMDEETIIELDNNGSENDKEYVMNECWHISIRFGRNILHNGMDPYSFISYLQENGEIINIKSIFDEMPYGKEMDPELCYLGVEINFKSSNKIGKQEIENVFDFIIDDCEIKIIPPRSSISEYVDLIDKLPENSMKIGEILMEIGSLTQNELDIILSMQNENVNNNSKKQFVGEIMVEEQIVQKPVLKAAIEKQVKVKRNIEKNSKYIRIDSGKIDELINLVGELVIVGANVKQIANTDHKEGISEAVEGMSRLIEDIRDSTMNVRMVQIEETFIKYERIVRDLSREKGKEIELIINGGDTELDKTLIDKISDPLTHLVRNAIDHGIGTPDERTKNNKPAKGKIQLNAYHETGSIIIEVQDDGKGLNYDKIFAKAVEKGLLEPEQSISDYDLFQYIFDPGFSTAEEVTSISGRGVGMDVVKKNIESLRGTISIESQAGEGTMMRIHLPLTLAIIDGFMVTVDDTYYVLPLDMVVECSEIQQENIDSKDGGNYINLRGDVLPFLKLSEFFTNDQDKVDHFNSKIIVVEFARKKIGLVVDDLIGEFQTVIKPMGRIFNYLKWISGSTILGTGEVAYILDVPQLIQTIQNTKESVMAHSM